MSQKSNAICKTSMEQNSKVGKSIFEREVHYYNEAFREEEVFVFKKALLPRHKMLPNV